MAHKVYGSIFCKSRSSGFVESIKTRRRRGTRCCQNPSWIFLGAFPFRVAQNTTYGMTDNVNLWYLYFVCPFVCYVSVAVVAVVKFCYCRYWLIGELKGVDNGNRSPWTAQPPRVTFMGIQKCWLLWEIGTNRWGHLWVSTFLLVAFFFLVSNFTSSFWWMVDVYRVRRFFLPMFCHAIWRVVLYFKLSYHLISSILFPIETEFYQINGRLQWRNRYDEQMRLRTRCLEKYQNLN